MGKTINFDEILIVNSDWNWIFFRSLSSCLRLNTGFEYISHSFSSACQNKMNLFVYNEKRNIQYSFEIFARRSFIVVFLSIGIWFRANMLNFTISFISFVDVSLFSVASAFNKDWRLWWTTGPKTRLVFIPSSIFETSANVNMM